MVTTHRKHKAKPAKKVMGISQDAFALGVTRFHLSRVVHGHVRSISLSRRYADLKASQTTTTTPSK